MAGNTNGNHRDESDGVLLERILAHFRAIMAQNSSAPTAPPPIMPPHINHYDFDFYLEKLAGSFDDVDEDRLRQIVFKHIDKINDICFKYHQPRFNLED